MGRDRWVGDRHLLCRHGLLIPKKSNLFCNGSCDCIRNCIPQFRRRAYTLFGGHDANPELLDLWRYGYGAAKAKESPASFFKISRSVCWIVGFGMVLGEFLWMVK